MPHVAPVPGVQSDTRFVVRFAVLVVALVFVLSCGIPQFLYLEPPVFVSIDSVGATFVFSHVPGDPGNDESFLGYEIYYRFYDPSTSETAATTDAAAIEAAAPGNVVVVLQGRGYRRIYPEIESIKPLLKIASADKQDSTLDVTVTFPTTQSDRSGTPASAVWKAYPPEVLLRDQGFAESYGDETFFSVDIDAEPAADPEDEDVPPLLAGPPGQVHMGIVVIAYGIDYDGTIAEIYSDPLVITEPTNLIPIWYDS